MKFEEVQQSIIQLYVSANAQLNILKLRAEAVILSTAQYEISEKDFSNGTIDSGDYASIKNLWSGTNFDCKNSVTNWPALNLAYIKIKEVLSQLSI